jgi:hypothetical protein
MSPSPLRQHEQTEYNKRRDNRRRERTAEVQFTGADRLVQEVADGCAEWSRQDERSPEEQYTRGVGPQIESANKLLLKCSRNLTRFVCLRK